TTLPPEIGQLTNLTGLYLGGNKLTTLPPEIGQLTNLTGLYLYKSELTTLPPEIGQLTNLTELNLYDNPLESPPPEIIEQGVPAIKEYLNSLKKKGERKVYEAKLLIVGQGGVGKTCLCNRLIYNTYNDREPATRGISFLKSKLTRWITSKNEDPSTERTEIAKWSLPTPGGAQTHVKMNVWDFGGQEIYHATHQFFLTKRSAYLLVWDTRQEDEYGRLDYWLNTIETQGGDSPIILVLNRCDECVSNINYKDYEERFPQIKGSYRVSCKYPEKGPDTFEKLKDEIGKNVMKLPLVGTSWPMSWWEVRETLEAEKRKQIDYSVYLNICFKKGVEKEQTSMLSTYLHDLGVVLHFQEDPLLRDTMILDPEWATRAVYKVLDAPKPRDRGGILLENDLDEIWKEEDGYPHNKHQTLLRLMVNFELAFQMSDTNNYIVAELLLVQSPDIKWDNTDNLVFQYHYDFFMPAGVMPRFIVRIHEDIERTKNGDYLCWREGAVLCWEGSRAYVRAIPGERRIEIRVVGDRKRELLAIIRNEFKHINEKFHKIEISQKIPCQCSPNCAKLFDYERLCMMEKEGIEKEFCEVNIKEVSIEKLLDGVETKEKRRERVMGNIINIGQVHGIGVAEAKEINQLFLQVDYEVLVGELSELETALKDKADNAPNNNEEYKKAFDAVKNAKEAAKNKDIKGVKKWLKQAGKFAYEVAKEIPAIVAAKGIIEIFKAVY
ncbi:MAG TPA: COR domain-containing protein, partial [Candidatus Brocadiia bacterium]